MTGEKLQCPKCKGEMVQGFVPDNTYGGIRVGRWYAGQPEKSFWTNTKQPSTFRPSIPMAKSRLDPFHERPEDRAHTYGTFTPSVHAHVRRTPFFCSEPGDNGFESCQTLVAPVR